MVLTKGNRRAAEGQLGNSNSKKREGRVPVMLGEATQAAEVGAKSL